MHSASTHKSELLNSILNMYYLLDRKANERRKKKYNKSGPIVTCALNVRHIAASDEQNIHTDITLQYIYIYKYVIFFFVHAFFFIALTILVIHSTYMVDSMCCVSVSPYVVFAMSEWDFSRKPSYPTQRSLEPIK